HIYKNSLSLSFIAHKMLQNYKPITISIGICLFISLWFISTNWLIIWRGLSFVLLAFILISSFELIPAIVGLLYEQKKLRKRELVHSETKHWRPTYHFSPPQGWMNDPCGLYYKDGNYHLAFIHIPPDKNFDLKSPQSSYFSMLSNIERKRWGKATTTNLFDWQYRGDLIQPATTPKSIPFSGSAIVDDKDAVKLIFTRVFFKNNQPLIQEQFLYNYEEEKLANDIAHSVPLIKKRFKLGLGDPKFRDPNVILYQDSNGNRPFWLMTLSTGSTVSFFKAAIEDLATTKWKKLSEFSIYSFFESPIVECADLVKVPHKNKETYSYVLTGSHGFFPNTLATKTWYIIGDFDGKKFIPDKNSKREILDFGPDFYAHQSWKNTEEPMVIAWLNNWKYAQEIPTHPWKGQMSIPRKLSIEKINDGLRLFQQAPELPDTFKDISASGRIKSQALNCFNIASSESAVVNGVQIESGLLELAFSFEEIAEFRLDFRVNGDIKTSVSWSSIHQELILDRSKSGEFVPRGSTSFKAPFLADDNFFRCKIYLDRSSVEVFAGKGKMVMSALIFPPENSQDLRFTNQGSTDLKQLSLTICK
ncbi:MAG: GH32 C-terminal domain-containing protein, partial [Bacteroidota bacterium]